MKADNFSIAAESISKRFGNTLLFKDISFSIKTGDSFSLTGPNGSGKTTLLHIVTALQRCTSGKVEYKINGETIPLNEINEYIGFISPNINPYKELTGMENIDFTLKKNGKYEFKLANKNWEIELGAVKDEWKEQETATEKVVGSMTYRPDAPNIKAVLKAGAYRFSFNVQTFEYSFQKLDHFTED